MRTSYSRLVEVDPSNPVVAVALDENTKLLHSIALADGTISFINEDGEWSNITLGDTFNGNNSLLPLSRVLDLAKVPNTNDSVYVTYIGNARGGVLGTLFSLRLSQVNLDNGDETILLELPYVGDKVPKHLGGKILPIEGNSIILVLGDLGQGQQYVQNEDTLWGKALLVSTGEVSIHAVGFSNPKSITWDQTTRNIYIVDDGFHHQKVDSLRQGSNYGWNIRKGEVQTFPISNICRPGLFPLPHYQIDNTLGIPFGGGDTLDDHFYLPQGDFVCAIPMKGLYWKDATTIRPAPPTKTSRVYRYGNGLMLVCSDGLYTLMTK